MIEVTPILSDIIINRYLAGETINQIRVSTNMSYSKVRAILRDGGVDVGRINSERSAKNVPDGMIAIRKHIVTNYGVSMGEKRFENLVEQTKNKLSAVAKLSGVPYTVVCSCFVILDDPNKARALVEADLVPTDQLECLAEYVASIHKEQREKKVKQ